MILGYHLDRAVRQILAQFASSTSNFSDAVNAGVPIPAGMVSAMHTELFPGGSAASIIVGERFTEDLLTKTAVVVEDGSKPVRQRVLGDYMGRQNAANSVLRGLIIDETCSLYVFHRAPAACRFLSAALCARLIASQSYFTSAGFLGFAFGSEGSLDLDTTLVRGWLGVPVRVSSWTATTRLRLPDASITLEARDVFVAPLGTENDEGVEGGVVAEVVTG